MARRNDITGAFTASIRVGSKRGKTVTTADFIHELAKVNHHWTYAQANQWIARYQNCFRDFEHSDSDNKTFSMMNMGYVR